MSAETLANETKVSLRTIRRAEHDHGPVGINAANAERIRSVLEEFGVCFIQAGVDGAGVRLRVSPPPRFGASKSSD